MIIIILIILLLLLLLFAFRRSVDAETWHRLHFTGEKKKKKQLFTKCASFTSKPSKQWSHIQEKIHTGRARHLLRMTAQRDQHTLLPTGK